jgi:hypothetical protein
LSKIISTKKTNAIFLAAILILGTFAIFSPSFMIGESAQAEPEYGMSYEKKYGYDKPYEKPQYPSYKSDYNNYKSKDSSISIKKVNCNNVNLNVNDASINVGRPPLGDTTSLDTTETEDQEITANNFANGERPNNVFKKDKDGFVFVCINNNNNEQGGETPPEELANLNVIKTVECNAPGGQPNEEAVCDYVEANISPEDYQMIVTGNSPDPSEFPGSSSGTNVELGEGDYTVDEEIADFSQLDLGPTAVVTNSVAVDGDCEGVFDNNNIFINAIGEISSGESQTCTIINTVNVIAGTVPTGP